MHIAPKTALKTTPEKMQMQPVVAPKTALKTTPEKMPMQPVAAAAAAPAAVHIAPKTALKTTPEKMQMQPVVATKTELKKTQDVVECVSAKMTMKVCNACHFLLRHPALRAKDEMMAGCRPCRYYRVEPKIEGACLFFLSDLAP